MDPTHKRILRSISLKLRHILEGEYDETGVFNAGDLERELNRIGIWRDRPVKPVIELPHLVEGDRNCREMVDAYLSLREEAQVKQEEAVVDFIRESAYTWANRLLALRCMEAREIIDPVIKQEESYAGRSMVHARYCRNNPDACSGEDDGLLGMLFAEWSVRSRDLPGLFDLAAPAVSLRPSVAALKRCITLLSGNEPLSGGLVASDEVFAAPDALGWAYQYWNAEEKDRVFEKVRTVKGAKIHGSDIIPATQLYTEPYMVKFLVQNSLGAIWVQMHPESPLIGAMEYYVRDADRAPVTVKKVEELTFLDPACGSGHFLIEAFDLLYQMYDEAGWKDPAEICRSILNNNLFGIDIDERAVQITRTALFMKASEKVFGLSGESLTGFHDHIIATNIRLPEGKDHLQEFLAKHPDDIILQPALEQVFSGLSNVHELGSLVQIEEPVEEELKKIRRQLGGQQTLTGKIHGQAQIWTSETDEDWDRIKRDSIARVRSHFMEEAERTSPVERFFAQSAVQGLSLFDLLSRRYDVVAANPPYMGSGNMGAFLKKYVERHYKEGKRDLFAAFILRNLGLTKQGGKIAMVTQQSWMFLRSYADLRSLNEQKVKKNQKERFKGILNETCMEILIQLGEHAFNETAAAGAFVALFILSKNKPRVSQDITAIRLIEFRDSTKKSKALIENIISLNLGQKPKNVYKEKQNQFLKIHNSPICYDLVPEIFTSLFDNSTIEQFIYVRQGVATTNNNRFLRFIHEIAFIGEKWFLYHKGGGYCKWKGLEKFVINWQNDGLIIKTSIDSRPDQFVWQMRMPQSEIFFQKGLVYNFICRGSLSVRYIENSVFDVASPFIKLDESLIRPISCLMNAYISSYILRKIVQDLKFHAGYIIQLPIPKQFSLHSEIYKSIFDICYKCKEVEIFQDLLEKEFNNYGYNELQPLMVGNKLVFSTIRHTIEGFLEVCIFSSFNISNIHTIENIINQISTPAGWFPLITNYDSLPPLPDDIPELPQEVIDYISTHNRIPLNDSIKPRLQSLYEFGPGVKGDELEETADDDEEEVVVGAYIPIPAETFLEELSQKMEIHPISVYWLLKEGIEQEGWRCIPEESRLLKDRLTVIILRLLGHRWPKQIEADEPIPDWADTDGIIPIIGGAGESTLLERVRERIVGDGEDVTTFEGYCKEVLGVSLEQWLASEFFKHHISQFKKRPVAWQLSSSPVSRGRGGKKQPAFSCLIYCQKVDNDILQKVSTQYVRTLITSYEIELRSLETRGELTPEQETRRMQLEAWSVELEEFCKKLESTAEIGFVSPLLSTLIIGEPLDLWTSRDGIVPPPGTQESFLLQEQRYDPDINDGVRVNIAPLQKAGVLAAEVIAKKDVEKAISDRAEWRADERRWCREGKLPRPGWWK